MKTYALLAPFKGFRSPKNTMEASGSSMCIASNSNNRTLNLLEVHETYNINYGVVPSSSTENNLLLLGDEQPIKGILHTSAQANDKDKTQDKSLRIRSRTRSDETLTGRLSAIPEEGTLLNPTLPSSTMKKNSPQDHTRNHSRSIRVEDAKDLMERSTRKSRYPHIRDDNISRRTICSARISQHSADGKGGTYKMSKLSLGDLRFSEPVEKHVKTYMTSKKQNFSHNSEYTICLWHPFSSLDLDTQTQEKHCILGDVGRFNSRGGFDVMFNIFMTMEENRRMGYFPPTTFAHFESSIKHWSRVPGEESQFFMTSDLKCTDEAQKSSQIYGFRSIHQPERPGSAILVAPGCTAKELNRSLTSSIRNYLSEQVEAWYDPNNYPNEQHEKLSSGSLNLICTCYKSKVWAAAATPRSAMAKEDQLEAKLLRSADKAEEYEWDVHPLFKANHGSSKPDVPKIEYTVAVEVCPLGLPSGGSVLGRVMSSLHYNAKVPFSSIFSFR